MGAPLAGFEESPLSFKTDADEWRVHPLSDVERLLRGDTGTPNDVVLGAFDPELVGHIGLRRDARLSTLRVSALRLPDAAKIGNDYFDEEHQMFDLDTAPPPRR